MTDLSELLERVRKATGRDIALEREIMCSIGGWQRLSPSQHPRNHKHPMFVDTQEGYSSHEGQTLYRDVPRIMESIDAALALVERVLPGWDYELTGFHGDGFICVLWKEGYRVDWDAKTRSEASTLPLAILSALLQALGEKP